MLLPRLSSISRTYRHMQRYREIVTVMMKYGFADLVGKLDLRRYHCLGIPSKPDDVDSKGRRSREERLRMALSDLGPTFVKLGQVLSTRHDMLPQSMVRELGKLQDEVVPFPAAESHRIIEEELGRPIGEVFRRFDDHPIASGSVAQVHEAITLGGQHVAVKVQRPGIRGVIETDLEIMEDLAALIERLVEGAEVFEPQGIVRELHRSLRSELDFCAEAAHMERMAANFSQDTRMAVPHPVRELTTGRVLTMDFVKATKVSDLARNGASGINREQLASLILELMFEQVFVHGFYHADPHPGNLLVLPGPQLCFLDYGITAVLSSRYREELSSLVLGLARGDEQRITRAVFRIAGYSRFERTERVEADVANFVESHLHRPLREIRIGQLLNELSRLLIVHDIRLPPDFFLLTKALTTADGVARFLAPELDIMEVIQPFARNLVRRRMSVRGKADQLYSAVSDLRALISDVPADARELLTIIKRGELRLKLDHERLDRLADTQDQVSNRIAFSIVLAALIVGSSLMVLSDIPPKWHSVPLIGVAGFLLSAATGLMLLLSIVRHRRM